MAEWAPCTRVQDFARAVCRVDPLAPGWEDGGMARRAALPLSLLLILAGFAGTGAARGEEDRFDPPLEGAYLGLRVESSEGKVVVAAVDRGSPAAQAGVSPGDTVLRLGEAAGFREAEEFNDALGELEAGRPVDLEVRTGEAVRTLHLITAPAILDVHYRMVEALKASRYFRQKD